MIKIWNAWKKKWNVETNQRMWWIMLIFSITGSLTVFVRKNLFAFLGIEIEQPILFFVIKLVAIMIIYQLLLFLVGSIMGENKFVTWFITKMNKRMIPSKKEK